MSKTLVEKFVEIPSKRRLFNREKSILCASELVFATMKERRVQMSTLARRVGWKVSVLNDRLCNGLTVVQLSDILWALDRELVVTAQPFSI